MTLKKVEEILNKEISYLNNLENKLYLETIVTEYHKEKLVKHLQDITDHFVDTNLDRRDEFIFMSKEEIKEEIKESFDFYYNNFFLNYLDDELYLSDNEAFDYLYKSENYDFSTAIHEGGVSETVYNIAECYLREEIEMLFKDVVDQMLIKIDKEFETH